MNIAGHKIGGWWIVGGAAGLGAAFLLYRHFSSASPATPATSSSAIDPVTNLPYSEDNTDDPLTGLGYLAEAEQYGSVTAAEQEVTSGSAYYGQQGTGTALDSGYPTIYPTTETSPTGPGNYTNNAAWAQAVTAGLAALSYNSSTVSAALGAFFAQMPLTTDQASIIQAAEAEYGPPPQGTYSIIPEPSTSTTPGTGTTLAPKGSPPGVTVHKTGTGWISVTWGAEGGEGGGSATSYSFGISPAPRGETSAMHNIGNSTNYTVGNLVPGTTYTVSVQAVNSAGSGPVGRVTYKA